MVVSPAQLGTDDEPERRFCLEPPSPGYSIFGCGNYDSIFKRKIDGTAATIDVSGKSGHIGTIARQSCLQPKDGSRLLVQRTIALKPGRVPAERDVRHSHCRNVAGASAQGGASVLGILWFDNVAAAGRDILWATHVVVIAPASFCYSNESGQKISARIRMDRHGRADCVKAEVVASVDAENAALMCSGINAR
jgi:hypothetical protein